MTNNPAGIVSAEKIGLMSIRSVPSAGDNGLQNFIIIVLFLLNCEGSDIMGSKCIELTPVNFTSETKRNPNDFTQAMANATSSDPE